MRNLKGNEKLVICGFWSIFKSNEGKSNCGDFWPWETETRARLNEEMRQLFEAGVLNENEAI